MTPSRESPLGSPWVLVLAGIIIISCVIYVPFLIGGVAGRGLLCNDPAVRVGQSCRLAQRDGECPDKGLVSRQENHAVQIVHPRTDLIDHVTPPSLAPPFLSMRGSYTHPT